MTKILLVEDDKSLREIYGVRLLAEGYDIVSAGDGEEALAMAIKERPQLIVSDVMMPKISGFDMLDILRSTTETKDIRVIMMTALSSEDQRARGEALGADRYLVKSQVGIEDVVRTVHEVLADAPVTGQTPAQAFGAPAAPSAVPRSAPPVAPRPVAPIYNPPAPTATASPQAPAPQAPAAALEQGRQLVQQGDAARRIPACVACHGAAMTGVAPSIPGLLGLPRDYLNSQLGAWKTGQRRAHVPDCMADIARQLTPDDVSAVSAWLAAQPVAAGGKPARTLPAAMPARCGGVAEVPVAAAAAR